MNHLTDELKQLEARAEKAYASFISAPEGIEKKLKAYEYASLNSQFLALLQHEHYKQTYENKIKELNK